MRVCVQAAAAAPASGGKAVARETFEQRVHQAERWRGESWTRGDNLNVAPLDRMDLHETYDMLQ